MILLNILLILLNILFKTVTLDNLPLATRAKYRGTSWFLISVFLFFETRFTRSDSLRSFLSHEQVYFLFCSGRYSLKKYPKFCYYVYPKLTGILFFVIVTTIRGQEMQVSARTCSIFLVGSEYWISIFYAFFLVFFCFFPVLRNGK